MNHRSPLSRLSHERWNFSVHSKAHSLDRLLRHTSEPVMLLRQGESVFHTHNSKDVQPNKIDCTGIPPLRPAQMIVTAPFECYQGLHVDKVATICHYKGAVHSTVNHLLDIAVA